ncbi:MAG: BON domain-containing protein [Methanomicrobiales archaeon]|nr:BON domain-containing protein [Methanomicrobiales archaeon]MDI6876140.1 BON domain-containing protein [Methanomicrobiales archaeon]
METTDSTASPLQTDETAKRSIEQRIAADPDLLDSEIRVSVREGVAWLDGLVDALWKRKRAGEIAGGVAGIADVQNYVTVLPVEAITDQAIRTDVVVAIERSPDVDIGDVDVEVNDRVVTLSGTVPTATAYRAALDAAIHARGVIEVVDNLSVRHP